MLFTDIEGSTRLLQRLGERYVGVLKKCRRLLRAAFQECNGYEVDTQGDAFFVVFERALDAVSAAILSQNALFSAEWPEGVQLRVRMGIHTGEPQPAEEGYVGLDVHRTARIMSVAHGGQVLLSQITRELVVAELPAGVALWYLGEHRLKDIPERTRLFQLALPGLPDHFPLLSTLETQQTPPPPPAPSTSFVGREQEVIALATMVCQPEVRLITLIGTAGVGKTRLALQVVTQVSEQFAGNLTFVSLEQIHDAEAVLPAIAQALGITEERTTPLISQISAILNEHPFLLILDNFEQVVPAHLTITQLLARCPRLKIVITSRSLLRIQAEHLFEVLPLSLPEPAIRSDISALARSPAVTLFLQRAQAVAPSFRLTAENAPVVQKICARLDGLPLAIELAAARLRHLPVSTILSQLENDLGTLAGTMHDLPERQRTLQGAIAWSYHLLEPAEQCVFRRLGVFTNGATVEALQYVCSGEEDAEIDATEIVKRLEDKSMVQQRMRGEREARFGLLQTLGDYGREQMRVAEEWENICALHAAYFLLWTERIVPLLSGAQQLHWLDQLDQEYENVRSALTWMLQEARESAQQAEPALRLCIALTGYWDPRGYLKEGLTFLEQALSCCHSVAASLQAQAYYMAGFFALMQDENERAEEFLRKCQVLFRQTGERVAMANILRLQGNLAMAKSSYKVARRLLEEALTIYLQDEDSSKIVSTREALAQIAMVQGNYAKARALTTEDLTLYRASGEVYALAYPLYRLARTCFLSQDDLGEAKALAEESLGYFKAVGNRRLAAYVLDLLGQISLAENDAETAGKARSLLEESLATFKAIADRSGTAEALIGLAHLALQQGETVRAREHYRESWQLLQTIEAKDLVALCLEGAGQLAVSLENPQWAAQLWGTAATVRATIVAPLPPIYRTTYLAAVARTRQALGEETFRKCWVQGSQTPWEKFVVF
jgi:predicted ATPase/class 3 adenylate cyclase